MFDKGDAVRLNKLGKGKNGLGGKKYNPSPPAKVLLKGKALEVHSVVPVFSGSEDFSVRFDDGKYSFASLFFKKVQPKISNDTRKSKSFRFSLKIDGKEIGRASLVLVHNDLHEQPYGLLEDVWVDDKFRNKGMLTKLMRKVIRKAKKENCYKIIATSHKGRKNVHSIYKHFGFTSHGYEFRMDL